MGGYLYGGGGLFYFSLEIHDMAKSKEDQGAQNGKYDQIIKENVI